MSKPRKLWWGYVKAVVRAYPELQARLNELRQPSTGGRSDGQPGAKGASRTTENVATRTLPPMDMKHLEAVEKAVRWTEKLPTGPERLKIIELVYWKQSHTLYGAAQAVGYSYQHASFLNRQFLIMVAQNLGLEEKSNTRAKNP
ncbi:MAG: hypothetical protein LUD78_09405 [Clostridiales bacterium]|nr:hypothetical protein [Clostridiales bacterium]